MHAYLVPASTDRVAALATWSADEIIGLLLGSEAVGIDKSWEAAFPLIGSITGGGMMIVDDPVLVGEPLVFGPAMLIDPELVAEISSRLAQVDDATVEAHWADLDSPFMMNGMYDEADGKEFAMYGYRETARVLARAAADGQGLLFAIL